MIEDGFRHEAFFYSGEDAFLDRLVPFIREGIAGGEPTMVTVESAKIDLLASRLDGGADDVIFVDSRELGRNPALIIPAWQDFVTRNAGEGRRVRGVGELIWPERYPAELVECQHHESLMNLAFAGGPSWRLICPYDVDALDPGVLEHAEHSHPVVAGNRTGRAHEYRDPSHSGAPFVGWLEEPVGPVVELDFSSPADLEAARKLAGSHASAAGMDRERCDGFVLAVDEVVTNSLRHGGGAGTMRAWTAAGRVLCEVVDAGTITEPLVGRVRPNLEQRDGRGLWIANHFCDLVQIRSSELGTIVRCHTAIERAAGAAPA